MTTSALIMMISAWTLIAYYTVKFFVKVLRNPGMANDAGTSGDREIDR